jgi:uncharacterized protein (TIGR00255 family)
MIVSMTGFGRAELARDGRRVVVEVRSVNHRGLDVKVRGRVSPSTELEILRAVRASVGRGSIILSVEEERRDEALGLDLDRARSLYRALEQLRGELGMSAPVDLATVAAFLRLGGESAATTPSWEVLAPAVNDALTALRGMRASEGAALAADLEQRFARLRALATGLDTAVRALPERAARRLEERLSALTQQSGVSPERLAQEVALLAEKLDVSEELTRLTTHLDAATSLLGPGGYRGREGVGRTLEFLLQEIGRELNTLGVKSQDAGVSAVVVQAKAELEKIREQAQNIE